VAACSTTDTDEAADTTAAAVETSAPAATETTSAPAEETETTEADSNEEADTATTVADEGESDAISPETQWALDYVGGTAGEASGDPIKIGYVNQENFFPENTIGVNAAFDFLNAELGGIGGRPVEVVPCAITVAEDGTRCGTELANDPEIAVILTGTVLFGNQELYAAIEGNKPLILGNGVTADDFTTTAGVSFFSGGPGVNTGLAIFIRDFLEGVESVAVIANNDPGAQAAANGLFKPVMDAAGIPTTVVAVEPTATAADVQSALTAVGADQADVLVPIVTIQQCINVYDSLVALDIDPIVVSTGLCFGTPLTEHLAAAGETGTVPDGWYFGDYGYSPFMEDLENGTNTQRAKLQEYGVPTPGATALEWTGFAGPSFANALTLAKIVNELGVDQITDVAAVDAAIRGFTGPMLHQAGPLSCGNQVIGGIPIFVALCASQMGVHQYLDGEWIEIAGGLKGNAIDTSLG
jgi:branched-chain amino acid transport system substrate-binding protein